MPRVWSEQSKRPANSIVSKPQRSFVWNNASSWIWSLKVSVGGTMTNLHVWFEIDSHDIHHPNGSSSICESYINSTQSTIPAADGWTFRSWMQPWHTIRRYHKPHKTSKSTKSSTSLAMVMIDYDFGIIWSLLLSFSASTAICSNMRSWFFNINTYQVPIECYTQQTSYHSWISSKVLWWSKSSNAISHTSW